MTAALAGLTVPVAPAAPPLAALRGDVTLHPGPPTPTGTPAWTLHDPVRNRFFEIGWLEAEMLAEWPRRDAAAIARAVSARNGVTLAAEAVAGFARFLEANQLLQAPGADTVPRFAALAAAGRLNPLQWLLHHYLYIRVPLVRPHRLLEATLPLVAGLYNRGLGALVIGAGVLALYLIGRQWDVFVNTFQDFLSWQGAFALAVALTVLKVVHELGHAYTATRYGCRVGTMGVAFIVMWPVLFTDTTEAWKLASRHQRLAIATAGVVAELTVAVIAALLWCVLPDGTGRGLAFVVASASWITTLAVNLNPFMRFDGYYLLCDLVGVANLQERSFTLARWAVRELLFGLGEPAPEAWPPAYRRLFVLYAWAVWAYRLVVFTGIAVFVYHSFFKLAGIVLFMVEIGWFVIRPVATEMTEWWKRRGALRWNPRTAVTTALAGGLLALLLAPWPQHLHAPAVFAARDRARIFAPIPAMVTEVAVNRDHEVAAGARIARLAAPDLDHDLDQVSRRIETIEWELDHLRPKPDSLDSRLVLLEELASARTEQQGYQTNRARLELVAPFAGVVVGLADGLRPGRWTDSQTVLAELVDPRTCVVEAYVGEADIESMTAGLAGRFHPDDPTLAALPVTVERVNTYAEAELHAPELASLYRGPLPVRRDDKGALVPDNAIYRIVLTPAGPAACPTREQRGFVSLGLGWHSLAATLLTRTTAVLIRESGF